MRERDISNMPWLQEQRSEPKSFDISNLLSNIGNFFSGKEEPRDQTEPLKVGNLLSNFAKGEGNIDYGSLYNMYNSPAPVNNNLFASSKPRDILGGLNDILQQMAKTDRETPGQGYSALFNSGLGDISSQRKVAAQSKKDKELHTLELLLGLAGKERSFGLDEKKMTLDSLLKQDKHGLDKLYRQAQINKVNTQIQNLLNPKQGNSRNTPATTVQQLNKLIEEGLTGQTLSPELNTNLLSRAEDEYKQTGNMAEAVKRALSNIQREEITEPGGWFSSPTKKTILKNELRDSTKNMPSNADIEATQSSIDRDLKRGVSKEKIEGALKARGYNQNFINQFRF